MLLPLPAHAQQAADASVSLGVSPALIEVALGPGQTVNREITLTNQAATAMPVSGKVESLIDTDEVINMQLRKQFDASTWVTLPDESLVLPKNENKKFTVVISVPKNATPGGHYAQVALQALSLQSEASDMNGRSIVIPEITISIFITVAGNINENLSLESENLFPTFTSPASDQSLFFQVANRGNVHALIVPKVIITKNGQEFYSKRLTPKVVLPNSIKQFNEAWETPRPNGLYQVRVEFTYGNQQKVVATGQERLAVVPPLWQLVLIGVLSFIARYLFIHRRNVKAAYITLLAK